MARRSTEVLWPVDREDICVHISCGCGLCLQELIDGFTWMHDGVRCFCLSLFLSLCVCVLVPFLDFIYHHHTHTQTQVCMQPGICTDRFSYASTAARVDFSDLLGVFFKVNSAHIRVGRQAGDVAALVFCVALHCMPSSLAPSPSFSNKQPTWHTATTQGRVYRTLSR